MTQPRLDRSEYFRQYREDHAEEIRALKESPEYKTRQQKYYQEHREEILDSVRKRHEANPAIRLLANAKARTKKKGLPPCDLTVEYIESITPEYCPILGIKLEVGNGRPEASSPSLDRIEPNLGYVRGNVQVISHKANSMKNDASWAELRAFAEWVLNYEYS